MEGWRSVKGSRGVVPCSRFSPHITQTPKKPEVTKKQVKVPRLCQVQKVLKFREQCSGVFFFASGAMSLRNRVRDEVECFVLVGLLCW